MFYYWYSDLNSFAPDQSNLKKQLAWYRPGGSDDDRLFCWTPEGRFHPLEAYHYLIDYTY